MASSVRCPPSSSLRHLPLIAEPLGPGKLSRRDTFSLLAVLGLGSLGTACGRPSTEMADTCGTRELGPDSPLTAAVNYRQPAPDSRRNCARCAHYVAPAAAPACGTCLLLGRQPVDAVGGCRAWTARS